MERAIDNHNVISNFHETANKLLVEFSDIMNKVIKLSSADELEKLETELHLKSQKLADTLSGMKLQEQLNTPELQTSAKEMVKAQPKKMKNMGRRIVNVRMQGGNTVSIKASYYHRSATIEKYKGNKGFYPELILLGVDNRYSPGLSSQISLLATAVNSFEEARQIIIETLGFKVNVKTIVAIVKQFAHKARSALKLEEIKFPDDFSGRTLAASTDGGRIRIRKNKRGKKTAKRRTRYKTDWREPKLIIIYVIGKDGQKERKTLPIIDASLNGPDETFSLLHFYLKMLNISAADLLLFISDGAQWIWERAKKLAQSVGFNSENFFLALDFYHAVEHLSDLASEIKEWDKKGRDRWVNRQKKRLLNGELEKFMHVVDDVCKGRNNANLQRERDYFSKHMPHMKYAELKGKGLPIGSGAVESAIRRVVNLRLKGPGIFWHEDCADAMLMLRSYYKAGRWNSLKNMANLAKLAGV